MSEFEDRERAFEKKFGLDEEAEFRVTSRTARLFAFWAAEQMAMEKDEAENYAKQVVDFCIDKNGHEKLITKIGQDLSAKGITLTRHHLEHQMNECHRTAPADIAEETKI